MQAFLHFILYISVEQQTTEKKWNNTISQCTNTDIHTQIYTQTSTNGNKTKLANKVRRRRKNNNKFELYKFSYSKIHVTYHFVECFHCSACFFSFLFCHFCVFFQPFFSYFSPPIFVHPSIQYTQYLRWSFFSFCFSQ